MENSPNPTSTPAEYDFCARFVKPTTDELRAGIVLKVGTRNLGGLIFVMLPKCKVRLELGGFDENAIAQLSYYSPPVNAPNNVDTQDCINWEAKALSGLTTQVRRVKEWLALSEELFENTYDHQMFTIMLPIVFISR